MSGQWCPFFGCPQIPHWYSLRFLGVVDDDDDVGVDDDVVDDDDVLGGGDARDEILRFAKDSRSE